VDTFIALSEFSRAKHREFGFPREMEVLPNFLPDPDPRTREQESGGRPHERPYFLFVGRLEQFKGLDQVIDLVTTNDAGDLVVIGDGSELAALRARAAASPRIRFLGRLAVEELGPFYRHAVALIAPSRGFETFGMSLIEAFGQSTPVIARRLGSFPEIVNKSGGGVLFDTSAELLSSMRSLLDSPGLRNMLGRRGYDAYLQYWSEGAVVPQYLNIMERAMARRAATHS
jgi:glycosyltransferase involved in cell wall biosynthesis